MAKSDKKAHQFRMDGMAYALKIAKEKGIEGLEQECKSRGARFVPLEIPREVIKDANDEIAERIYSTFMCTVIIVLADKFGFGKTRLERFMGNFKAECNCLANTDENGDRYVTFTDLCEMINEKYGIDIRKDIVQRVDSELGEK